MDEPPPLIGGRAGPGDAMALGAAPLSTGEEMAIGSFPDCLLRAQVSSSVLQARQSPA
jgi:hypothetical protein